jgi:hypothetical protein
VQCLHKRQTADAVDAHCVEHADVVEQDDTGIFIRTISTERNRGRARVFAMPKIIGNAKQNTPIIRSAIPQRRRHFRILSERTGGRPLLNLLTQGQGRRIILVEALEALACPLHVDDNRAVHQRQWHQTDCCHCKRREGRKPPRAAADKSTDCPAALMATVEY